MFCVLYLIYVYCRNFRNHSNNKYDRANEGGKIIQIPTYTRLFKCRLGIVFFVPGLSWQTRETAYICKHLMPNHSNRHEQLPIDIFSEDGSFKWKNGTTIEYIMDIFIQKLQMNLVLNLVKHFGRCHCHRIVLKSNF